MSYKTGQQYLFALQTFCIRSIYFTLMMVAMASCKQRDEAKIKKASMQYIKGRIALRTGDSLELKSVTDPDLFRFIMLNEQYVSMMPDVPHSRADLTMSPVKVNISGEEATCKMSGDDYYFINLSKNNGNWTVMGENDKYISRIEIDSLKAKINRYKLFLVDKPARDSVMKVVWAFYKDVKEQFKKESTAGLEKFCDAPTINFVERFLAYAHKRSGETLLIEINEVDYTPKDVIFNGDRVSHKFYQEESGVELRKTEDGYIITGFNGHDSGSINQRIMEKIFFDLLRALGLVREKQFRNKAII